MLTKEPILKVVDPYKYYRVCIDARKEGLGGILSKKWHVVCYESRKLKDHEINYVVHDLELETLVHALKMWIHYLLGKKFLLVKNNTYVKNLFNHLGINPRQALQMALLSEFDLEVKHIKGKENKVVDSLN